jgi:hypothetical protein
MKKVTNDKNFVLPYTHVYPNEEISLFKIEIYLLRFIKDSIKLKMYEDPLFIKGESYDVTYMSS